MALKMWCFRTTICMLQYTSVIISENHSYEFYAVLYLVWYYLTMHKEMTSVSEAHIVSLSFLNAIRVM